MANDIPVDAKDARFQEAVKSVLDQRLPRLVKVEDWLRIWVVVLTLLSGCGLIAAAVAGARVLWKQEQDKYIRAAVDERLHDGKSPLVRLSTHLQESFRNEVDSASFKILRYGCTDGGVPEQIGFPTCSAMDTPAGSLQARENQSVLLVANPTRQTVTLDMNVMPLGQLQDLESLFLRIVVEPPPVQATAEKATRPTIVLTPEQLEEKTREFVQDGRLRLFSEASGTLRATVDLTRSLATLGYSGPIQLAFKLESPDPGAKDGYAPAKGRALFVVKTVAYAHHSIPSLASGTPQ